VKKIVFVHQKDPVHRQFIAASCKFIPHLTFAMMAEAMEMTEGLSVANSKGCNSVIAEGDLMETIQACMGSDVWWTEPAAIYVIVWI
jgi:hypothetical protein